eukprot:2405089-Pleurochrysis_carterae.AAC.1
MHTQPAQHIGGFVERPTPSVLRVWTVCPQSRILEELFNARIEDVRHVLCEKTVLCGFVERSPNIAMTNILEEHAQHANVRCARGRVSRMTSEEARMCVSHRGRLAAFAASNSPRLWRHDPMLFTMAPRIAWSLAGWIFSTTASSCANVASASSQRCSWYSCVACSSSLREEGGKEGEVTRSGCEVRCVVSGTGGSMARGSIYGYVSGVDLWIHQQGERGTGGFMARGRGRPAFGCMGRAGRGVRVEE